MPDGTCQPVVANFVQVDDLSDKDIPFSFTLNPFYARMSVYETFQSP